ncbi:inosamine-phosphate amidinotransferase 1 [Rhodococcus rhodnii]|uniref:Glycine amidinotransferase n=3 Tax=Rhodococcus rhodnii TaxID=38312 RepID=R7WH65_9NOCA|nr:hypothetical protein Rrhod_4345 [Rhodococcus rhodnii LMG 5362]TXG92956.1 inosamine-phosphate amidinotransferase 1 [Rhodococcus rhodnii]
MPEVQRIAAHSNDEWTPLREVVVGRADDLSAFHFDSSFSTFYWDSLNHYLRAKAFHRLPDGTHDRPIVPIDRWIVEELNEDIEGLATTLTSLGVTVHRPSRSVGASAFSTPYWETIQSSPLNVRDQAIVLGDTIIETAPHVRSWLFENDYLKPVFYRYFEAGSRWLSMPRPSLAAESVDRSYYSLSGTERAALSDPDMPAIDGLAFEMIFDGAQCIRLGRDVLVNVANRNHELGLCWLDRTVEGVRFHRLDALTDSHMDSMALPLRPGLWLTRSRQIVDQFPEPFRSWDVLIPPPMDEGAFPSYERTNVNLAISSTYIDMNVLSVDETTVIVNSLYLELVRTLEHAGFTVVPVRHRHRRLFGGGFHCFTLDTVREGTRISYA